MRFAAPAKQIYIRPQSARSAGDSLRQPVAADSARRRIAHNRAAVRPSSGTGWNISRAVHLEIGLNHGERIGVARRLLIFERPGLGCAVNLAQVVHAGILLRGGPCADQIWDRYRGQQANDSHHDHDFNQREPTPGGNLYIHTKLPFCSRGVSFAAGEFIINAFASRYCLPQPRL